VCISSCMVRGNKPSSVESSFYVTALVWTLADKDW
jgi:hypothetical protein